MTAVVAALVGSLILAAVVYDMARLVTPYEGRCPPLARIRGRRAALESAEMWLVGLRLQGRVDATTYRTRMHSLALGERTPRRT
ncbi:hypothetical protein [Streptomyces sp. CdTB01]|uniref:hypothetical protein n=1 Tax=Streptomyces sp. CdTB01 TaxID=1725411 RepID=UPI00073AA2A1|nr:hypothetical protein [Streptomyces sp. CdTB01]ALV33158.1 hypothetical protein AS200_14740 [Streptomyces sp. CdTB01]